MSDLKVLLTGARGMVGKNITDLKPNHIDLYKPAKLELNLLDYVNVKKYINTIKPDIVIHAAGIVGGIQANINHPVKFLRENMLMAHNLIWASFELSVPYILNLGSSCMYPRNAPNPLKEDVVLNGELEPTNEGYALSKIFAQRFCQYINYEQNNINYKTLIPCNLYGKYDKFDTEWGHMIPSVIQKIHKAKQQNMDEIEIWGNGEARREFMFSGDFADFVWFAIDHIGQIPELLNVGLGYDYSINEYYKIIARVVGFNGSFKHNLTKPVGMKQKLVDISRLNQTEWVPKYTLEQGIKETYDYYLRTINN